MIPAYWHEGLAAYLWQVALHSLVLGLIFYIWARRERLPSGATKRRLLTVLLVLPLFTAAVPGRSTMEFRGRSAWFDSGRVLATPLAVGDLRVYHLVLAVGALTVALAVWQELVPLLGRRRRGELEGPDDLVRFAQGLPGWERCMVTRNQGDQIMMATGGWPGHPRLVVSQGAVDRLSPAEQRIVARHEHAHWKPPRWVRMHVLFVVRLAQLHNPVALWAFREYCLEEEIGCDADAIAANGRSDLGRVLLAVYGETDRRDVAARAALRKRVDVLLGGGPVDGALPTETTVAASVVMLGVLPWLV